jgi:hypothetical protein
MIALGVRLRDSHLHISAMRELVRLAEDKGYDSVWLPESMGRDACAELTALAVASTCIRIGTGVVPVFVRIGISLSPTLPERNPCKHHWGFPTWSASGRPWQAAMVASPSTQGSLPQRLAAQQRTAMERSGQAGLDGLWCLLICSKVLWYEV